MGQADVPLVPRPISRFRGFTEEYRNLHYFQLHASHSLAGNYRTDFWSKTVLQMSESELAIMHAIASLALFCEHYEATSFPAATRVSKHGHAMNPPSHAVAFQQYNKAIASLSHAVASISDSSELVLVCCLLLTCIDFVREQWHSAVSHAFPGIQILAQLSADKRPEFEHKTAVVRECLLPIFARVHMQCMMVCGRSSILFSLRGPNAQRTEKLPVSFEDQADAGNWLTYLVNATLRLFKTNSTWRYNLHIDTAKLNERDDIFAQLKEWY